MTDSSSHWLLQANGSYEHRVTGFGAFFASPSPKSGLLEKVLAGATVTRSLDIEACREAWLATRFEMPAVAVNARHEGNGDCIGIYTVPTREDALAWAHRSIFVHEGTPTREEQLRLVEVAHAEDQNTVHIFKNSDDSFDIHLRLFHGIIDTYGAFVALNCFLRHLGSVTKPPSHFGEEVARLPVKIGILLGLPKAGEEMSASARRDCDRIIESYHRVEKDPGPTLSAQVGHNPALHGFAQATSITRFDRDQTLRIRKGFKRLGLGIGSGLVYTAAIARYRHCLKIMPNASDLSRLVSFVPISLRRHLGKYEKTTSFAFTAPIVAPSMEELATASRSFERDEPLLSLPSCDGLLQRLVASTDLVAMEDEHIPAEHHFFENTIEKLGSLYMLSSFLGPLDEQGFLSASYGDLHVSNVTLSYTTELALIVLQAWTFAGELHVKTAVNLNHWPESTVHDFEEGWLKLLRQVETKG